jgi:hypothetical protein
VTYHYGRWANDRQLGWFWVPGDDWAPAWVDWRYGGDTVGWAPLPPDDVIEVYDERPDYWVFVPLRRIGEPRLRTYYLSAPGRERAWRDTRLVNRPVHIEGRRIWVNPGLAPGFIAGRTRVNVQAYQVRPRVFGGTTNVQGAVTVRPQDFRTKGAVKRIAPVTVQRTTTVFQPSATVAAPQPLGKNDRGVLGPRPPRAAQGAPTAPGGPQPPPQPQPPGSAPPQPQAKPSPPTNVAPPPSPPPPPAQQQQRRVTPPPSPPPGAAPPARPSDVAPSPKPPGPPSGTAVPPPQQRNVAPPPSNAAPPPRPTPPPPPPPPPKPPAPPPQQQIQRAPAPPPQIQQRAPQQQVKPPPSNAKPAPGDKKPDEVK